MPRDYTDPNLMRMYSPRSARVSHTMQRSKKKSNKVSRSGRKPRSNNNKTMIVRGAPAAVNFQAVTSLPALMPKPKSDALITVRHQEYISNVLGSTTQNTTKIDVNPGLASTFPWLSNLARNYETYLWRSLTFEYLPEVGSQTKGRIMMVADYDARDGIVADYRRLGSMHGAAMGTIWSPLRLTCDKADLSKAKQFYVRSSSVANTDIKTYDSLSLQYNVGGTVDGAVYGCIRASYTVDLMTPQVEDDVAYATSKKIENTISPTPDNPFAGALVTGGANLDVNTNEGDRITFPSTGEWLLSTLLIGTGLTSAYYATTVLSGAASDSGVYRVMDATSTHLSMVQKIMITSAPAILRFTIPALTSLTAVKTDISQFDYHL